MATTGTAEKPLEALAALVTTTKTLITQLEPFLHAVSVDKPSTDSDDSIITPPSSLAGTIDPANTTDVDALALAHDAASLIRAHATKLSLLIINEPFTPTAVSTVLRELVAGPIPGLASAVQACGAATHTRAARRDLAGRCGRVLRELGALVEAVPRDGRVLRAARKDGGKGSLALTGVVWAACDDVIRLRTLGLAGLLVQKVEEYRDTLKDVLEELKEWSEELDEEDEEDNEEDGDAENGNATGQSGGGNGVDDVTTQLQNSHIATQEMLDDFMTPQRIPRNDPDKIRERLDSCLKRLRLTTLLYSAIIKRRLKVLPSLPITTDHTIVRRVDEVIPILKGLPHRFGDVAFAFYNMDRDMIDKEMDSCFFDAFAASEMMMKSWEGQRDEFTEWAEKFQVSIKKPD